VSPSREGRSEWEAAPGRWRKASPGRAMECPCISPFLPLLELRNIRVTLTRQVQSALPTMDRRRCSLSATFGAVLDTSGRQGISGRIGSRGGSEFDADVRICQVDGLPSQAPPARSSNLSGSTLPGVGLLRESRADAPHWERPQRPLITDMAGAAFTPYPPCY
jgi:hypothetical protein